MGSMAAGRFFLFDRVRGDARLRASMPKAAGSSGARPTPAATRTTTATARGLGRPRSWTEIGSTPSASRGASVVFGRATGAALGRGHGHAVWCRSELLRRGKHSGRGEGPGHSNDRWKPSSLAPHALRGRPGHGTGLVAFHKLSGKVRWSLSNELASYSTPRIVTMGSRRRGFAFTRGGLLGFDPARGTRDFFFPWRARSLESVNAATPVIVNDTVFVSETYGPGSVLLKIPPRGDPEVLWRDSRRNQSLQAHWNTPVHHTATCTPRAAAAAGTPSFAASTTAAER